MPPAKVNLLQDLTHRLSLTPQIEAIAADATANPRGRVAAICHEAGNPIAIATLWMKMDRPTLVITPNPDSAQRLVDQIPTWISQTYTDTPIYKFPENESIPFERYEPDRAAAQQRLATIDALATFKQQAASATQNHNPDTPPPLVVTSINAAVERTISTDIYQAAIHTINIGDRVEMASLLAKWTNSGYELLPIVEAPGHISRRGGILDIFPVGYAEPIRIELFDDEVESIRAFDIDTQRSSKPVSNLRIIPAREEIPNSVDPDTLRNLVSNLDTDNMDLTRSETRRINEDLGDLTTGALHRDLTFYGGFFKHGSIFDFLPVNGVIIALRPKIISDTSTGIDRRMKDVRRVKERRGEIPRRFPSPHSTWNEVAFGIESANHRIEISTFGVDDTDLGDKRIIPIHPPPALHNLPEDIGTNQTTRIDDPIRPIKRSLEYGATSIIIMSSHAERLHELATQDGLKAHLHNANNTQQTYEKHIKLSDVNIVDAYATAGFLLELGKRERLTVLTDAEIFGIQKQRHATRRRSRRKTPKLEELQPGVYVVHEDHGIAKFLGTKVKENDGREQMILQFARNNKVYIPTEYLDRIQIYQGGGESAPRLSRLGTQEWASARRRAKRATELVASELLALYAARMLSKGLKSQADSPWQQTLEASFPYEETPDQLNATEAIKLEMQSDKSMDRIVCGDVGFGKTEIALRAAFKAVQSGRQVAVLVPTTLLAQQHYQTFTERLAPFPVSIEVLSRFKSREEQKEIVKGLAQKSIDIVIGTHRLIQRDINIKNLGLVIIDEEQKFGVQHKEHLKRFRAEVDVLTLSATPIPRTLYMSLAGIRDMSNIETPPEERLPVKTFVSESSDDLIRQAILREIDRGGQVFFLHNRVKDIERVSRRLHNLVPEASITIGHGQMPEGQLEQVMTAFHRREYDVLVCTTIIEAGIDMPNVNTLVVNDADRFGLAQLHHIRGRVGRSARQAFSYLLVQPNKSLTEEAEARLNTILAATELGAGFQIAMRDLEIRGMGNVIGAEQSGHVAAIGLHLYTQLLSQSVEELKKRQQTLQNGSKPQSASNHQQNNTNNHSATEPDDWMMQRPTKADVRLGLDDRIPEEYIEDLPQRLGIYQRISWCRSEAELAEIRNEMRDRFGPIPLNVEYLLQTARIKLLAQKADVSSVRVNDTRVLIILKSGVGDARAQLQKLLGPQVKIGSSQLTLTIYPDDEDDNADDEYVPEEWIDEIAAVLETIHSFKQRIMNLVKTKH